MSSVLFLFYFSSCCCHFSIQIEEKSREERKKRRCYKQKDLKVLSRGHLIALVDFFCWIQVTHTCIYTNRLGKESRREICVQGKHTFATSLINCINICFFQPIEYLNKNKFKKDDFISTMKLLARTDRLFSVFFGTK